MKIYIVTSGEYSDYQVQAVFSTEEKAMAYIDAKGTDYSWGCEEYDVDSECAEYAKGIYTVSISLRTGEVSVIGRVDEHKSGYSYDVQRMDCIQYSGSNTIRMWLVSDSLERVKKVASERMMQVKALQAVAFPHLYTKVVCDRQYFGLPLHEYPLYNFYTKQILLSETQTLDI